MTRRHLQRLTEGVYHFSRRTQSTVELWYPWKGYGQEESPRYRYGLFDEIIDQLAKRL
ncbi:hypothetical protein TcasGA2_TC004805 [Tribolium castaneum]|uniref:Uncharacterized protein n=1 Tax=Tribolium castaneum TaxID=7070 RepID=D6W871_TRICA|nr:hypothetical protein TcasGA2_TC004805 [Tribolium castaneum]